MEEGGQPPRLPLEPTDDPRQVSNLSQGHNLQVGPCLSVGAYLEGSPVNTILDSGAGVSIVGKRFTELHKKVYKCLPKMDPIALTIKGVNSAAALQATAVVSFPLSFGPKTVPHLVSAVMVPGWDGEILLGWNDLMALGITFILDEKRTPTRVRFTRLGVECKLNGPCSEELARETRTMVQTIVAQMGKEPTLANPIGKPKDHERKELEPVDGKAGKLAQDPKVREIAQPLLDGRDRRSFWKKQQRKRWQSYKIRSAELAHAEVQLATAASLKPFLAQEGKQESDDGWSISEEGLKRLTQRGWPNPTLLVGRYAGRAVMEFLKSGKEGTILFPWAEPTAGHVMEALDRTDDVPLLIPSIHMYRTHGRTITKECWVTMRIASVEKAEAWRAKSGQHFRSIDLAGEAKSVGKIAGACTSLLVENETDPMGPHPAAKLYRALKDTVLGESQQFSSVTLGQEDPEEEEENWKALEPPRPSESKTPTVHGNKDTLAEYLKGKSDNFCPELLDVCWKYRRMFDGIEPGSVKTHAHRIDLNTAKELKARIYSLKNDSQKESARSEIERLLKDGMIAEIDASQFLAPIVMAPKKSADGKQVWRFCCDFRLLNEHTVSDKYPMPSLERQLDVGKARYFTKMDLASAFWQIPIAPEDQHKTAFHFEGRSYKWLVMPFGLKNAPPTFQRLVDKILSDLLGRGVYAYINDILI